MFGVEMGKTSSKMVYIEFRILGVRIKYNLSPVEITEVRIQILA